jgi:hypothetical protein
MDVLGESLFFLCGDASQQELAAEKDEVCIEHITAAVIVDQVRAALVEE